MEEFTLLELEIDELSFTNTAPVIGKGSPGDDVAEETDGGSDDEDGGMAAAPGHAARRLLAVFLGLAFAVAVARALFGSEDEELEDLAVLDESDVEA